MWQPVPSDRHFIKKQNHETTKLLRIALLHMYIAPRHQTSEISLWMGLAMAQAYSQIGKIISLLTAFFIPCVLFTEADMLSIKNSVCDWALRRAPLRTGYKESLKSANSDHLDKIGKSKRE